MTIHVFITLRKPTSEAHNFEISRILNESLLRIQNQTFKDFKVYVICSIMPIIAHDFNNVFYKLVDIPFPYRNGTKTEAFDNTGLLDKGMKLLFALQNFQILDDEFIYFLDYDDLVNNELFENVNSNAGYDVLCLSRGYVFNETTERFLKIYGINLYCGSTFIYKKSFLIKNLDISSVELNKLTLDELFLIINVDYFKEYVCDHPHNYFHFIKHGVKIKEIDIFSVAWVVGNGQNMSNVQSTGDGLKINSEFSESFSIKIGNVKVRRNNFIGISKYYKRCISTWIKWFLSVKLNRAFY